MRSPSFYMQEEIAERLEYRNAQLPMF